MATNQENIALDVAAKGVQLAGQLQRTLDDFAALLAWGLAAGIDLSQHDEAFAQAAELQHVNGTTLNLLFALVAPGISGYLAANVAPGAGGDTYQEIVQKARRS